MKNTSPACEELKTLCLTQCFGPGAWINFEKAVLVRRFTVQTIAGSTLTVAWAGTHSLYQTLFRLARWMHACSGSPCYFTGEASASQEVQRLWQSRCDGVSCSIDMEIAEADISLQGLSADILLSATKAYPVIWGESHGTGGFHLDLETHVRRVTVLSLGSATKSGPCYRLELGDLCVELPETHAQLAEIVVSAEQNALMRLQSAINICGDFPCEVLLSRGNRPFCYARTCTSITGVLTLEPSLSLVA